jgi:uncharacterized UBP type Zn finger protein
MDASSFTLYCFACKQYVFEPDVPIRIGVGVVREIRGLANLGNTCFMNVILQSVAANPLFRDYFLADKHRTKNCMKEHCLGCAVNKLVRSCYIPSEPEASVPIVPHELLYSVWRYANHLAGYDQQDAHEFFISFLDGLKRHCANDLTITDSESAGSASRSSSSSEESVGIVDHLFGGMLKV